LRLKPPAVRFDFYDPAAWQEVADNRRERRQELKRILAWVRPMDPVPTVIGGDFNTQPGDPMFKLMPPGFRDCFYEAGSGWCDTAVNDYPLARPDQLWVGRGLTPIQLVVRKTVNSDHRMVICDVGVVPSH